MHWSFSRLKDYETCPARYEQIKVLGHFQETVHPATLWGTRLHLALEERVKHGTPFEPEFSYLESFAQAIIAIPGETLCERELACTRSKSPTGFEADDAWARGIVDVLKVNGLEALVLDYKGLALDTPIPTPKGWTTMGEVSIGDEVYDMSGMPCPVVGKSEVKNIPCMEIIFDDTSRIVCDNEHRWVTTRGVVDAPNLRKNDLVLLAQPLHAPDAILPIDPYILGLWLADGKHCSGEVCKPDPYVWHEVYARGGRFGEDYARNGGYSHATVHTIYGLRTKLRECGILSNKHIPASYLRASYAQRLDLLRGLMDGDGSVNKARKQCVYSTTNEQLADNVFELLCSLGQRPLKSKVKAEGFGLVVSAYPVTFRPQGINPFASKTKASRVGDWGLGNSWRRRIISIAPIQSVPTQCISVDSPSHTFLCGHAMIPTHNSGKVKPTTQLKLMALLVFINYPDVQVVKTRFLWIQFREKTDGVFHRADADRLWEEFEVAAKQLEEAHESGIFMPKPSGLCKPNGKGYAGCPVKTCEFCGRGSNQRRWK